MKCLKNKPSRLGKSQNHPLIILRQKMQKNGSVFAKNTKSDDFPAFERNTIFLGFCTNRSTLDFRVKMAKIIKFTYVWYGIYEKRCAKFRFDQNRL